MPASEVPARHRRQVACRQSAHTIPTRVLRVLQAPRETFGLAAISIWEVGKKVQIGKLSLPKDPPGWFGHALTPNIEVLPLEREVVLERWAFQSFRRVIRRMNSLSRQHAFTI